MVDIAKLLGASETEAVRQMSDILEFAKEVANVSHLSLTHVYRGGGVVPTEFLWPHKMWG